MRHNDARYQSFIPLGGENYLPEMIWRDNQKNLFEEIQKWLLEMDKIFDYRISVFVAPSNKITQKCLQDVVSNGLNYWFFRNLVEAEFGKDHFSS